MDPKIFICPPLMQISRQSPRNTRPYPKCLWDSGKKELSDLYGNPWQAARSSSALTDPTEKVLKSEYSEFYSLTVIFPFSFLREGKRRCMAGLLGIKDRERIVQEAEFMVAARCLTLKRPPHGAQRFSRTSEPVFKDSEALLPWKCLSIAVGAHRTKLQICFQQITHWYTLWSQGILHHRNYFLFFVSRNMDESYAAHLLLIQQKASAGQWFWGMQNLSLAFPH